MNIESNTVEISTQPAMVGLQYVSGILSVNQFLQNQYLAKEVEMYLYQEIEDSTGEILKEWFKGVDDFYGNFELKKFSEEDNYSYKMVKFYDKIVSLTFKRNLWIVKTLHNFSFELRIDDVLICR
jgi:hypothetical protein